MQSSTRKAEMLDQIHATRQALEEALARLDAAQLTQPGVNGEWSVKDMLAHIAWWEEHRTRILRGESNDLSVGGVDLAEDATTDQVNAAVFAANQNRPLSAVRAEFDAAHRDVLTAIEALAEDDLASDDVYDGIAWDTFRHYPEHTAMLTTWAEAAG